MILAIGNQLTLLSDKGFTLALLAVYLHQFKAQIAALRLLDDRSLKQRCSFVQLTLADQSFSLLQHISSRFGQRDGCDNRRCGFNYRGRFWSRCRCLLEIDAARSCFKAVKAARRHIQISRKLGFMLKIPGHSRMFLRLLHGIATTHQEQ